MNNPEFPRTANAEEPNASKLVSLALNYFKPPKILSPVKELSSRQINKRLSSLGGRRQK